MEVLPNCPRLKDLRVGFVDGKSSHPETTLRGLLSKVPQDKVLPLDNLELISVVTEIDAGILPHLLSLKSITLISDPNRTSIVSSHRALWRTFQVEGIRLEKITARPVTEALLEYIASYQGLNELALTTVGNSDQQKSDRLATQLFQKALPPHVATLQVLRVASKYEDLWCVGEHNIQDLRSLSVLRELEISFKYGNGQERGFDFSKIITTVLESIGQMRSLRSLILTCPFKHRKRRWNDHSWAHRARRIEDSLAIILPSLGTVDAPRYPSSILCGRNHFKLQPADSDITSAQYVVTATARGQGDSDIDE
ncbi:hypothetical protein HGRIS_014238 [Hohenbuehelia grisea]|uniref:Uncharacterized protein n=1 Tax=Hohenbuehelia grisea TaxID=104357 RepID=A0ABR3JUY3_9AGAR